jgi:hypothetical protein
MERIQVEKLQNEDVRAKYHKLMNGSLHMKWAEWKQSITDENNVQLCAQKKLLQVPFHLINHMGDFNSK